MTQTELQCCGFMTNKVDKPWQMWRYWFLGKRVCTCSCISVLLFCVSFSVFPIYYYSRYNKALNLSPPSSPESTVDIFSIFFCQYVQVKLLLENNLLSAEANLCVFVCVCLYVCICVTVFLCNCISLFMPFMFLCLVVCL